MNEFDNQIVLAINLTMLFLCSQSHTRQPPPELSPAEEGGLVSEEARNQAGVKLGLLRLEVVEALGPVR